MILNGLPRLSAVKLLATDGERINVEAVNASATRVRDVVPSKLGWILLEYI